MIESTVDKTKEYKSEFDSNKFPDFPKIPDLPVFPNEKKPEVPGFPEIPNSPSEKFPDFLNFPKDVQVPKAEFDADQPVASKKDVNENVLGGAYKDITFKEGYEKHHMPADVVTDLPLGDGPSISMEKIDHRRTASCGYSIEAQEYRAVQKDLVDRGKFKEAFQMDVDDIHDKFGDKYNDAIDQCIVYVQILELEGRI